MSRYSTRQALDEYCYIWWISYILCAGRLMLRVMAMGEAKALLQLLLSPPARSPKELHHMQSSMARPLIRSFLTFKFELGLLSILNWSRISFNIQQARIVDKAAGAR